VLASPNLVLAECEFQSFRDLLELLLKGFQLLSNCRKFLLCNRACLCNFVGGAVSFPHHSPESRDDLMIDAYRWPCCPTARRSDAAILLAIIGYREKTWV
jgi:hypothetical protein